MNDDIVDRVEQLAEAVHAEQTGRRYRCLNCGQWFVGSNLANRFVAHMEAHSRTTHPSNREA